jgi:hypothetical protein
MAKYVICCALALGGCAVSPLATEVLDAPGATGTGFRDPSKATNGVRGGGRTMQSLDVYAIPLDAHLVLGFGARFLDGPGDDLALFENPFEYAEGRTFVDAAIVEVSADGERWVAFAHDYVAEDEARYSSIAADWIGFGGVQPVFLHEENNPLDPFDDAAGGDRFDLAALEQGDEADRIRREGARYVRIAPAASRVNPDSGVTYPMDPVSDGPDIDGVYARYLEGGP